MNLRNTLLVCSLSVLLAACGGSDDEATNAAPKAETVAISGTATVGETLTGSYSYSDAESDVEGASLFKWTRNGVAITGADESTYVLTADDAGKTIVFTVTPVASSGTSMGNEVMSSAFSVPLAEAAPMATAVSIAGALTVGQQLTGSYAFNDVNSDNEGTSTFQWYRDGDAISGETSSAYTLTAADQGSNIVFGVTPVAISGTLVGAEVMSTASSIPAANSVPTATNVTINGTPAIDETLTGSYTFNDVDHDAEGASTFSWYRNDTLLPNETGSTYVIVAADIGNEITFGVLPMSASGVAVGVVTKSAAVTGAASLLSRKCNATTDAAFVDTFVTDEAPDRDFVNGNDVAVASESFTVAEIAAQFNAARAGDVTIKEKLAMPEQTVWDAYTTSEKMLYLINAERCARGLMTFEGIDPRVVQTSQEWADLLSSTGRFDHGTENTPDSVTNRLGDAGLDGNNMDAVVAGENLTRYFRGTATAPTIAEVEARSVYFWMYQDYANGNLYGHRKLLMTKGLSGFNDHGSGDSEGLFGAALTSKSGSQGAFTTNTVTAVMHVFNPNASYVPRTGEVITPAPEFIAPTACISGTLNASNATCEE